MSVLKFNLTAAAITAAIATTNNILSLYANSHDFQILQQVVRQVCN
jgi:hypothetical protein